MVRSLCCILVTMNGNETKLKITFSLSVTHFIFSKNLTNFTDLTLVFAHGRSEEWGEMNETGGMH